MLKTCSLTTQCGVQKFLLFIRFLPNGKRSTLYVNNNTCYCTQTQITGSRCGTLKYVPFEEDPWPLTENNLGGPYWERRLSQNGRHASEHVAPMGAGGAGGAVKVAPALGPSSSSNTLLRIAGVLSCLMGDLRCGAVYRRRGRKNGKGGRRFVGPRKPRGRSKVLRRSTADASLA